MKIDCSLTVNYLKEEIRRNEGLTVSDDHVNGFIAGLQYWSDEHPQKTYLEDFIEKFPSASFENERITCCCVKHVGYIKKCPDNLNCRDCWNQIMEVK